MKVSDIYKCSNVIMMFTNAVINDGYANEVFDGNWSYIPESIMNAEVDFWHIIKVRQSGGSIMADKIFVALK